MMYGKVRWFNKHFGYGFIRTLEGEDVFFHYSSICDKDTKDIDSQLPPHYSPPQKILVMEPRCIVKYEAARKNGRLKATKVEKTALLEL